MIIRWYPLSRGSDGSGSIATRSRRCWRETTSMLPMPIRVTLSLVVVTAAYPDWRWRRIPIWLTLPAVPVGIVAQSVFGEGIVQGLAGALAGFLPLFLAFAMGAGGAGDVKLLTAVGAFVGLRNLLPVFV